VYGRRIYLGVLFFFANAIISAIPTFVVLWFGVGPWRIRIAALIGFAVGLIPTYWAATYREPLYDQHFFHLYRYGAKFFAACFLVGAFAGPWYVIRKIDDPDYPNEKWDPPNS
jgi:hypothetical protein